MTETTTMDPRLVTANVTMLEAQARMFDQQARDFDEAAKLKAAEVRQKVAHALAAEYGAQSMRVQTEATLRSERITLASNHMHHVYNFKSPVYEDAVDTCIAQLLVWDRLDSECEMTVKFNSPGGSVLDGMDLFDEVHNLSLRPWDTSGKPKGTHKTVGVVRGWAASMAGILIQAFDERVIGPRATLMIHEISTWARGKVGEIEDELKFLHQLSDSVVDTFVTRSNAAKEKNPEISGITKEEFTENWNRREWYVSAEQALDYGFVDRIG
jgi:ATP-dependent protease ClpP protease subunit